MVCDECHSEIHGIGYGCVKCEKLDFCYKCIDPAIIEHNPTHRIRTHNNAVYFASGHSVVSVQGYASFQANLRDACSKSKNHLPFVVRGFFVDKITKIGLGGIIQRRVNGFRVDLPWENWTQLLGLNQVNGLESEGTKNAAFLRALVGNRLLLEGERGVSHLPNKVMEMLYMNIGEDKWACDMEHPTQLLSSTEVMLSNDRRLATSAKYLGFVPPETRAGDRIAILIGCSVPVVLRDVGHLHGMPVWQLVGECYIDGIMEGEFIDFADEKNLEPEKIVLV
ncbi:hypothetical protein BDP81DRAFT_446409 [Colletotrichum phormii]|uniref:ZZ-type domain-containing protein n=1 Tax=Colletotrichum phormii TaxID=359342 RepID=A0AAI9ZY64_9PEZI|nr:uncharacterized protein BDP81DRAFT_446409 [Colletotrichum phormii]KAK1640011.1 hypothetical protein BDP81DRAFT_446409 [Colletotrichum phormii]